MFSRKLTGLCLCHNDTIVVSPTIHAAHNIIFLKTIFTLIISELISRDSSLGTHKIFRNSWCETLHVRVNLSIASFSFFLHTELYFIMHQYASLKKFIFLTSVQRCYRTLHWPIWVGQVSRQMHYQFLFSSFLKNIVSARNKVILVTFLIFVTECPPRICL